MTHKTFQTLRYHTDVVRGEYYILLQWPVKITGPNIVLFCMLITILNTLFITMQNV